MNQCDHPRKNRYRTSGGFTLKELLIALTIIATAIAILLPTFDIPHRARSPQAACSSNEKQILLAMLGYVQDYDERLPPAAGVLRLPDGSSVLQEWGVDTTTKTAKGAVKVPSITGNYVKNNHIFHCPSIQEPKTPLQYTYNDLAAAEKTTEIAQPNHTVLILDGEDTLQNVGHARVTAGDNTNAIVRVSDGRPIVITGEAVSDTALGRHSDGCNFGLADGHVKWFENVPGVVFFPPRSSRSPAHRDPKSKVVLGPDPGGTMTYQGIRYAATFHLR